MDMTIVFIGFDGYCDLWDDCMALFWKFWPDCPYEVIFVNNTLKKQFRQTRVIHAGEDAEWSKKVQCALAEVKTEYVCLLLEDFFVGKTIDTDTIKETVEFIKKEKIKYYKLVNMSRAVRNRDATYKGIKYLHIIPESDEYGVSLQAAIWEKDYLSELVGKDNYNAWKFEFDRVRETDRNNDCARKGCVFDERNILNLKHGVVQSKYIPGTVRFFKKQGIELNINRDVLTEFQYAKIQFTSFCKYALPKNLRVPIKRIMEKAGYKFVSTTRDTK